MSNKVWMITGAPRGLGAQMSKAVLASGDALIATARKRGTLEYLGEHEHLLKLEMDVTDEQQVKRAVKESLKRFTRIDVIVNNAGYGLMDAVEECSSSEVRNIFSTNVFGLLNVIRAVLPAMRSQHSGHIINLSSTVGFSAALACGIYSSTKFAVEGVSEALYAELLPLGIHVTVVEPGGFRTEFLREQSIVNAEASISDYAGSVGMIRGLFRDSKNIPLPGDPSKLAQAVLHLASSDNPPLRLPLGTDALQRMMEKNAFVEKKTGQWRTFAMSTDH
jgi:NADP-dependent 3-hydroxy acid dehydrogenase YdfG